MKKGKMYLISGYYYTIKDRNNEEIDLGQKNNEEV